ncbi:MAG: hypothetical protein U0136_15580 [Bdellovibrionota bacterium]
MSDLVRFRALSQREQAVVATAVLLDGHDAAEYLSSDKDRKTALSRAAKDLAEIPLDLRLPLLGTLLREALRSIRDGL